MKTKSASALRYVVRGGVAAEVGERHRDDTLLHATKRLHRVTREKQAAAFKAAVKKLAQCK